MSFCPSCRQEYESFATECPDCEVKLVAELPSNDRRAPTTAGFFVTDERLRDHVIAMLRSAGVKAEGSTAASHGIRTAGFVIEVPTAYAQGVASALGNDPNLEEIETPPSDRLPLVGAYKISPRRAPDDAIHESALLKDPVPILVRRGEEIVPELSELVRRGDPKLREAALGVVYALGARGRKLLNELLLPLAREKRSEALFAAAKILRDMRATAEEWEALFALANDAKASIDSRCLALHVLGRTEMLPFGVRLLPLLDDADELIREAADEAICTLADDDMGFEPEMQPAARAPVVEKWRKHFQRRGVR